MTAAWKFSVRTLALFSCAVFAHAQTPAEPARLVRLNVVAVDSSGQPAAGLTADDFQITDQNKPQKIAVFSAPSESAPSGALRSNRPAPGTHATAILFDFLNENRPERMDAARKLAASLKQVESADNLFLYLLSYDGKLVPLHEIPKDPGAGEKGWTADAEKILNSAVKTYNKERPAGMLQEDGVKKTYVAMETIANQLAAFPGRRDIVWITSAVPYTINPQIECKANWWDCALYVPHLTVTLDHAGVMVDPFSYIGLSVDASRTMEELAGLTGGRSYPSEDLTTVLKQFGQGAGTYEIAYAPPADGWDSKFHRVRVSTERKGVKIQAKQHYYALPDQRPMAQRQQAMMVAAYQSSSDVADLGLRAGIAPGATPNTVKLDIRVDPADLALRPDSGKFTDAVTVLLSARSAAGPQGEPTLSDQPIQLTKEQRDAAMKDGIAISRDYPIDAATKTVRVIVLDKSSDSVGSLTIPVGK